METWCPIISITTILLGVLVLLVARPARMPGFQIGLNLVVSLPMIALFVMLRSGGHPTAQLNAASGPGVDWWSFWMRSWPLWMVLLLGAIVVACVLLVITIAHVIRRTPRHHAALRVVHAILSCVQATLTLALIGGNFPDA